MTVSKQDPKVDIEASFKRIRLQIKHGRMDGVSEKLDVLLKACMNTDEEVRVLEVYALEFFSDYTAPACAIPILQRLLNLSISPATRAAAQQRIDFYSARAALVPTNIDLTGPDFVDCLTAIRSGEIFSFRASDASLSDYQIVRNLQRAQMLAWHQAIEEPYMSWNSLRAKASAQVNGYLSWNKIGTDPLDAYYDEIAEYCSTLLPDVMMNFFDDILGDLTEILQGKAAGVSTILHEKMWQAYRVGAYPCGWEGNFPEGRLCVFQHGITVG